MGMRIYELSEVAEILAMPKSRVKNWTIGRPLRITPSVRAATGKGSRNLYSVEDVYLIGLADQLNVDGFAPKTTEKVLKKIRRRAGDIGKHHPELIISSPGGKAEIEFLDDEITRAVWDQIYGEDAISCYTLDLQALRDWVDRRIAQLEKKRSTAPGR
jgi:hypothetical protein